jgi:hypothetical protein
MQINWNYIISGLSALFAGISVFISWRAKKKSDELEIENQKLQKTLASPFPFLKPSILPSEGKSGPFIRITNYGPGHARDVKVFLKGEDDQWKSLVGTNNISGPVNFIPTEHLGKDLGFEILPNVAHYDISDFLFQECDYKVKLKYKTFTEISIIQYWGQTTVDFPHEIFSVQDDYELIEQEINY